VLVAVHPDQHSSAGLDRLSQLAHCDLRLAKVVYHADAECDIESVPVRNIVKAALLHFRAGKLRKIPSRGFQTPVVQIDGYARPGAIRHRPIAISTRAASAIEKVHTLPIALR